MRGLRNLLLLLVLPGALVPGGLALHVCLCRLAAQHAAKDCCSNAVREDPEAKSCCQDEALGGLPGASAANASNPAKDAHDCQCVSISTPSQPCSDLPQGEHPTAIPAPITGQVAAAPPVLLSSRIVREAPWEPPWVKRSLPLRI